MSVAEWTGSLLAWEQELAGLKARLADAFGRVELRRSAGAFIDGALSGVARKTGWQLAEQAELDRPYRLQSLLGRSAWKADSLRDLVRAEVLTALGDAGGDRAPGRGVGAVLLGGLSRRIRRPRRAG